jgi:hypothetical protein
MSKEVSPSFCEVCGIDVNPSTDLKSSGKIFCSLDHLNQYTRTIQKEALQEEEHVERPERKRKEKGWRKFLKDLASCC